MQPAASHNLADGQIPRLRAEKCFSRGACPREKRIALDFAAPGRQNSAEGFWSLQDTFRFLHRLWLFRQTEGPPRSSSGAAPLHIPPNCGLGVVLSPRMWYPLTATKPSPSIGKRREIRWTNADEVPTRAVRASYGAGGAPPGFLGNREGPGQAPGLRQSFPPRGAAGHTARALCRGAPVLVTSSL